MAAITSNAIAWAQFRLRGSWRTTLSVVICYIVVVIAAIGLMAVGLNDARGQLINWRVLWAWRNILLFIQSVLLVVLGSNMVAGSIRRDMTSRQIESNRLMPLGSRQVILGYIVGATLQMICLWAATLGIGLMIVGITGMSIDNWIWANLSLLLFSVVLWSLMALMAFITRGAAAMIIILVFLCITSEGLILVLCPALLVLCPPIQTNTIFVARTLPFKINTDMLVSTPAQLLLIVLLVRAAARKYDRAQALAFPVSSAIVALFMWALISVFGAARINDIAPRFPDAMRLIRDTPDAPLAGSLVSGVLVAMGVMASAAWTQIYFEHGKGPNGDPAHIKPLHPLLCLAVCVALICAMELVMVPDHIRFRLCLLLAAVVAMSLAQTYLLMRLLFPATRFGAIFLLLIVGAQWTLPFLADLTYDAIVSPERAPHMDVFAPISVLNCIPTIIVDRRTNIGNALLVQLGLLLLTATVFWPVEALRRHRRITGAALADSWQSTPSLGELPASA